MNRLVKTGEKVFPPGAFLSGLIIMGTGILSVPLSGMVGRLLLSLGGGWGLGPLAEQTWLTIFALLAQNGVWLVLTLSYLGEGRFGRARSLLRLDWTGWSEVWVGIRWGFLLLVVNGLSAQAAFRLWGRWFSEDALAKRMMEERAGLLALFEPPQSEWLLLCLFVLAAGVAPIVEEVLFRGLLHNALRPKLGRAAIWASSAIFASVHLYLIYFLPVFALGVLLAWLYERRGNLVAPIVAHASVNAIVALAYVLAGSAQGGG